MADSKRRYKRAIEHNQDHYSQEFRHVIFVQALLCLPNDVQI
jgi:hypothetical protein